jgi:2-polyprenyl-6-methoxyphenol hydroxylase-like FAD-dependent oxidoreductase
MNSSRDALIIGGGIAGPVTAMALQRAGIKATVYEAYPTNAGAAGAFLTIAVNGLDALRTLDLHRQVMAAGFPTATIELFSGTGKRLGQVPIGGTLPDGTMTHTIKRADLYRILYEETLRRDIRIEHGKRLVAAESTPAGVVARFEDGTSATGDLLIGADGIHSRTRRIIDPAAPAPRHTGLGNIGGFTRTPIVASTAGAYVMIFGKRAFFGYTVSTSGDVWWFANPGSPRELSGEELAAMTSEQWKALLLDVFVGDAGPATQIIRGTTGMVLGTDQHDMPKVPTWYRGPMIIIGDAAHAASPSSGQGASMAIEDALVLAKCLRDVPDSARAFAAFEQIRRPRVERVVAFGARSSSSKAPGPLGRVVRDLVLPTMLKLFAKASQDWLYGYHIDWDARVRLQQAA